MSNWCLCSSTDMVGSFITRTFQLDNKQGVIATLVDVFADVLHGLHRSSDVSNNSDIEDFEEQSAVENELSVVNLKLAKRHSEAKIGRTTVPV